MKKYFLYIIAVFLLLDSCKKTDHSNLLTAQEFPTTIGSWWKYQVLNQNNKILDTLTITIVDMQTIGGISMQRWSYNTSSYADTVDVLPSDTSIGFYNYGSEYLSINFPVIDNESWTIPIQGFSYKTGIQNITVQNTSYNGAIYLNQYEPPSVGTSVNESIWIVKNIGIVQHIINDEGGPPYSNEQLIAYHIN
jgi:hypothetical protein